MKVTVYAVHVEAEGTDTRWNPAHVTYSQRHFPFTRGAQKHLPSPHPDYLTPSHFPLAGQTRCQLIIPHQGAGSVSRARKVKIKQGARGTSKVK